MKTILDILEHHIPEWEDMGEEAQDDLISELYSFTEKCCQLSLNKAAEYIVFIKQHGQKKGETPGLVNFESITDPSNIVTNDKPRTSVSNPVNSGNTDKGAVI